MSSIHGTRLLALVMAGALLGMGAACRSTTTDNTRGTPPEQPGIGQFCGGIAAMLCPEGLVCVDDPRDDCDPLRSGADCGGVCIKPGQEHAACQVPGRRYVSRDPEECSRIRFMCEQGSEPFSDGCGCGCQPVTP